MDIIDGMPHSYLGDGVYAMFDGFGIWLRANDHREEMCSDKIYMEPSVIRAFNNFVNLMADYSKERRKHDSSTTTRKEESGSHDS